VDPTFATQIHDYDPGITDSGLFWTIAFPDDSVHAELHGANARFKVSKLAIADYGDILNGLFHSSLPAMGNVSFDIRWSGAKERGSYTNSGQRFRMEFVQTGAHITWSGKTGTDTFHTTAGTQEIGFAQIARQRSGVFFDHHQDDEGD
jgi:hypothetical protein